MESRATLRNLRMSPRKVRVVLRAISKEASVEEALARLQFNNRAAAKPVYKLLVSAVANADQQFGGGDPSNLFIKEAYANEGPTLRRFRPRAMGRATRINKRTSHVTIVVAEMD